MGLKRFFKKIIPKEIRRPIKAIVDPVIDFTTNTLKAVVSPFTGGFDLPDVSLDVNAGSGQIKAATTVDFNAANRAIPVLYGNNVSVATIPVFVGTHGDDSADTSKQYLYMAAVISQGFHGAGTTKHSTPQYGSVLSRLTIDGKPVNLGVGSQALNTNYSSRTVSLSTSYGGIRSSGKGGVQPTQHSIAKGTFANRLTIQYFDGSSDQPASSLLREHPDWDDDQNTLSGIHYVAMRFELKAADEVVGGSDGNGTFKQPYSSTPAVVVTTSGRSIPNITVGHLHTPSYHERFQSTNTIPEPGGSSSTLSPYVSHHIPLNVPAPDGLINGVQSVATNTVAVDSDTVIEIQPYTDFQAIKYNSVANGYGTQPFNVHNHLFSLGWTYDYVFMVLDEFDSNTDMDVLEPSSPSTGGVLWLKHVGGGHYRFIHQQTARVFSSTVLRNTITFVAYDSNLTEAIINGTLPDEVLGDSTTAEYRFYGDTATTNDIWNRFNSLSGDEIMRLRVRDLATGRNDVYQVTSVGALGVGVPYYVPLGLYNEDSTALPNNFYSTIPVNATIYLEIHDGFSGVGAWDPRPANLPLHRDQGYLVDGLSHQGYFPDGNPVEYLFDYMLNPNYGMGLSVNDLDTESFIQASIAGDRSPDYFTSRLDRLFYMGGTESLEISKRNEYMYGPNANPPTLIEGDRFSISDNTLDRQMVLDTSRSHLQNVNEILTSMGAIMDVVDGKFKLILENAGIPYNQESIPPVTALPITAHINDEHIIDAITLNTASVNDKFNLIKLDYTDLSRSSQPDSVMSPDPVDDSTNIRTQYLAEDNNKPLEGNFTFRTIYEPETAQRMATLLLKKSRGQPTLNFVASHIALNCLPGDFIRITSDSMKLDDVFRITSATLNNDHTVAISCIRHVPDFYDITDQGQLFEARRNIIDIK